MKKIFVISLCLLMCLPLFVFPVSAEAKENINALNMGRGENQIIIYTTEFGKTTGTNEWGIEAVVGADNKIIRVTKTGNETIPEGGFVVSAHGEKIDWVNQNCKAGLYCYYDSRSMTVAVSDAPIEFGGMFYTVEKQYTKTNATREEDDLVIYTIGGSYTKTNDWGCEVVVNAEGKVTSVGGNNKLVPKGGFVVSGHGVNGDWLTANVQIGMQATLSTAKKTVTFVMDADAYLLGFDLSIKELEDAVNSGKESYLMYNYNHAEYCLERAKTLRNGYTSLATDAERETRIEEIESVLREGLSACTESCPAEYRGVWIRPTQKTRGEVADYVQKLKDQGMNTLCIETLYDSTLICPPPEGSDFEQNPKFGGFDVLEAYVEECHAREMELHVWMPVFYSSHTTCSNHKRSVWYKNPEWRMINDSGKDTSVKDTDDDFCFLNPALPEVREMLLETYKYLITEYDVDGFELDYIRYPDADEDDHGYDEYTVTGFQQKHNLTVTPTYDRGASYWSKWVQYRCDIITGFVGQVREMFNEYGQDVLLCADVGESPAGSKDKIYQQYDVWLENGFIDLLKPMSYTLDSVSRTDENVARADGKFVAAGIGVFSEAYSGYDCAQHTAIANSKGADGVMFFESSAYIAKNTADHLITYGAFREYAITPTSNPERAIQSMLSYASRRILQVIVPLGGMTETEANDIVVAIDYAENDGFTSAELKEIISTLPDTAAGKAVKTDLEYALKIIKNTLEKNLTEVPDDTLPPETSLPEVSEEQSDEASVSEESASHTSASAETSDTSEGETQTGFDGTWILIVSAAVILAAIIILVIFLKKNK